MATMVAPSSWRTSQKRADVSEPLHCDAGAAQAQVGLASRAAGDVERAACGGLDAAEAADLERLAGDDAEDRMTFIHRVRVEDPGHHLCVRAYIGGGDVLLGADLVDDLARVAPGRALELTRREGLRVDDHAALRAAERNPDEAHFQVIRIESALTSSTVTSGWYRMPPFDGPRAMLWMTR